jgi:hypothetical protein
VSHNAAEAFWPFTRGAKAVADSTREREWQQRFDAWKGAAAQPAAGRDSSRAASVPQAPAPANRNVEDLIRQARDKARADSLQASGPGSSSTESLVTDSGVSGLAAEPGAEPGVGPATGDATTSASGAETDSLTTSATAEVPSVEPQPAAALPPGLTPDQQALLQAAAAAGGGFRPKFSSSLVSSNDRMRFDSSLNASFNDPSGVTLSAGLTYDDEYNLNQNTNNRSRGLTSSFTLPLRDYGMNFALRTSNNQRDVLGARTTTNERSTTVTDSKTAGLTASIGRQLIRGVGANASYAADFRYGSQDITATGSSSGDRENKTRGQSYGVGMNFDRLRWLQLQGRVGRAIDHNTDITSSFITADNPLGEQESSSRGDSVVATVSMPLGPMLPLLSANYRLTEGRRSFTDPARTSSGGTGGGGTFVLETEQRYRRSLQMRSTFVPISRMNIDASFEVSRDSVGYEIRQNAYNDTRTQRWSLRGSLQYHTNGTLNVNYDYSKSNVNRDEVGRAPNPQTRTDRENRLTADVTQTWTGSLKTRMYAELRLNQGFYLHEGPQGLGDRDDFRTQLGLNVEGVINKKMRASMESYVRTFDQAFIDPRRSASSRNETEYVVRLDFHYQITKAFKLNQKYGLSSKVLDEIYNPLRNTLSRNHFLQTHWTYVFNSRLSFGGLFNYILQDNGAYLDDPSTPFSSERFYSPTQENRKNEAKVDVRYAVLPDGKLSFTSSQQVVQDRRTSFDRGVARNVTTTRRSNLALGVDSTITLGELRLKSRATRNQNLNSSINRDVFYNIDATLTYDF